MEDRMGAISSGIFRRQQNDELCKGVHYSLGQAQLERYFLNCCGRICHGYVKVLCI